MEGTSRHRAKSNAGSRNDNTTVMEKLQSIGMKPVAWVGKCEADKVSMGKCDVAEGEGGMYGSVFDNTFSKQVSKTVTFVLMTYPTNTPPRSGHHLHFSQVTSGGSQANVGARNSPTLQAINGSSESLPLDLATNKAVSSDTRPKVGHPVESKGTARSTFYTGVLHKKRRKRNQGYARRFFSLDFTSSTLSYYKNRHSSALRGAIPLSLAAIGTYAKRREISVDSGAEVWLLRASNQKDFDNWKAALEKAAQSAAALSSLDRASSNSAWSAPTQISPAEERDWARVESLVGRVAGSRDAVRRLAKDTDPKYLPSGVGLGIVKSNSNGTSTPSEADSIEFVKEEERAPERMSFWRRKSSTTSGTSQPGLFRRSVSAQLVVPTASNIPPLPTGINVPKRSSHQPSSRNHSPLEEGVHDRCTAILRDLDSVVAEFSVLIAESRQRRMPPLQATASRQSFESTSSEEFFDAEDGGTIHSQLLTIHRDSDESDERSDGVSDAESEVSSDTEDLHTFDRKPREGQPSQFPSLPKSLTPLPLEPVRRRATVSPPKANPPSLIAFLRKNVGKDLSTIAMPVSANEPTSALQRVAEQMEYSELLDSAAASGDTTERLLHVAAFAIASFSNNRVKERAIRKPFNPMLGETYELVREDKGFRFIAEKVSHRPMRMACQAESRNWIFMQSPMPVQKFWGKSAELMTDGRARVFLRTTNGQDEHYSWTLATSFLRNIIAGEKYIEPVGSMTVINESNGAKAVVTFKAGGLFAGRSEEVSVATFAPDGSKSPLGLAGKWTSHLSTTSNGADAGKTVWTAGSLVDDAPRHYGFTAFAAALNETTPIEQGHVPLTDSRLRPDQRAVEGGELDRAEALKARLEERQRARRRVMEEHGEEWAPRWFTRVEGGPAEAGGEEVWRLKTGREGYWEERARGEWTGVLDVFQA